LIGRNPLTDLRYALIIQAAFNAHPEHYFVVQVPQLSWVAGAAPSCWDWQATEFFSGMDARADSWSIWILVAPTVMAMAMISFISSAVTPDSLATARQ
jgi:hypothetical protein